MRTALTVLNVILLVLIATRWAQAQEFVWAKQFGGDSEASADSVAVDANGNNYTVGTFKGTADFDPGAGNFSLTAVGQKDVYVSQLDSTGNFVWAAGWGGPSSDNISGVAINSDTIYTVGTFQDAVDFDPGQGEFVLISAGASDVFLSLLDSAGNFVWAGQLSGPSEDGVHAMTLDNSDHIYIVGYFYQTTDFDPSPEIHDLTSEGLADAFVTKMDAAGDLIWAVQMGGTDTDQATDVVLDGTGSVCTVGTFDGTADFDPGEGTFYLVPQGPRDSFVAKLDSAGEFLWARHLAGTSGVHAHAATLDSLGNVYVVGFFEGVADFDPSSDHQFTLTSAGEKDGFVCKLDSTGDFIWARQLSGGLDVYPWDIAIDSNDYVYTVGRFDGTVDFGLSPI